MLTSKFSFSTVITQLSFYKSQPFKHIKTYFLIQIFRQLIQLKLGHFYWDALYLTSFVFCENKQTELK